MEAHGGSIAGPAEAAEAAHAAAATLVGAGREADDPQRAARLVRLVEDVGLDTLADLWAQRPARSLPGVLWRLYVLRAWVWRAPSVAAREYAEGMRTAEVQHVSDPRGRRDLPVERGRRLAAWLQQLGVRPGDRVISSGDGGVFPAGLVVGQAVLASDGRMRLRMAAERVPSSR